MNRSEDYEKLIDYIEQQLFVGKLKVGDRLPAERELSAMLDISRGSVRIGLAVLVAIGVVDSKHGSGNYINGAYDHKLTQVMTMIYALCDMNEREVVGLRYASEQEAILLAHQSISQEQKDRLLYHLEQLETVKDPDEQTVHDQMIHSTIVEASNNRLVIAQYTALNKLLNEVIHKVRNKIADMGEKEYQGLQSSHRDLVVSLCNDNYQGAKEALDDHFYYMMQIIEEEDVTGLLPNKAE